ncbi:MAG: VWA domain-containing protein [Candidatus Adiutrix intracellularis]|jgi:magnesium chelatase subunit D|nr:VWA domain-containing protein [Candidatus Adiutrix intracellularis]
MADPLLKIEPAFSQPANNPSAVYPLVALVGQELMVEALLILAVDPSLGGLLLVGEKGTAKSTAARALAELLPPVKSRAAPFRTLPLGVTEDRLLGGLDWENTLKTGRPILKPGLLSEADEGLIYIDEINLLDPSLAHLLLDTISAGRVLLEREGLSATAPARVALLATMNPEEGQLGPQLVDRFALTVTLAGEADPNRRAEVVRRRLAFEADPYGFHLLYATQSATLAANIREARKRLPDLKINPAAREQIAILATETSLSGHRGDLALAKAARARAALLGLNQVGPPEILAVSPLILPARTRPAPIQRPRLTRIEKAGLNKEAQQNLFEPLYLPDLPEIPPESRDTNLTNEEKTDIVTVFKSAPIFKTISPRKRHEVGPKNHSGRRQTRETNQATGRSYCSTARRLGRPLALAATLRAAAPYQVFRKMKATEDTRPLILTPADLREKVYRLKTGRLILFLVDSSGSIGTLYRMEEAKAAVLALLAEAYQKRDRVALIAFYGHQAELLLPPTNSPDLAARLLAELPSGGKTPLSSALVMARKLLRVEQAKDPILTPQIILMTDGRPNIPLAEGANPWTEALTLAELMANDPRLNFLVIDTDQGAYNDYKLTRELAKQLRAPRLSLENLREGRLETWLNNEF